MDDGFAPLPKSVDVEHFKACLNNLHPNIKYTIEPATTEVYNAKTIQKLSFLDITVILHEDNMIETEIYYIPSGHETL